MLKSTIVVGCSPLSFAPFGAARTFATSLTNVSTSTSPVYFMDTRPRVSTVAFASSIDASMPTAFDSRWTPPPTIDCAVDCSMSSTGNARMPSDKRNEPTMPASCRSTIGTTTVPGSPFMRASVRSGRRTFATIHICPATRRRFRSMPHTSSLSMHCLPRPSPLIVHSTCRRRRRRRRRTDLPSLLLTVNDKHSLLSLSLSLSLSRRSLSRLLCLCFVL